MSIWHAAYNTLALFGGFGVGCYTYKLILWCWQLFREEPDLLPQPEPDERDSIAEFQRIIDRELS